MAAVKIIFILLTVVYSSFCASGIYKYKDASGKWVFTDKKPVSSIKAETIEYSATKRANKKVRVYIKKRNKRNLLVVKNSFHAPIELEVKSALYKKSVYKQVVPAASTITLYEGELEIPRYRYRWILGDPDSSEASYLYRFPVSSQRPYKITQSFRGRFSHSKQPSLYAVDIAMEIGTYITAARSGTVIWVKDDYHMGGKKKYFLDKANYVKVLHEDGTYAVYAHILQGTALVKAGDAVQTGDRLARSGSSGYSTGPHLHFVIRRNEGFKTRSIPFRFAGDDGIAFTPQRGMQVVSGKAINNYSSVGAGRSR